MKKILFTLCLALTVLTSFAQEEKNQEFKFNIGYALDEMPEFTYEYILNEESAIGASVLFAIGDTPDLRFALTPYYRFYFGNKRAAGFFAEAFTILNATEESYYFFDIEKTETKTETGLGAGIAIGGKWITKRNWIFEIYSGFARNFINDKNHEVVPRAGLTLGKRF